jgi:hypothetical protein
MPKQRKYLEENVRGLEIELTAADLEEIDAVAPGSSGGRAVQRGVDAGGQRVNAVVTRS